MEERSNLPDSRFEVSTPLVIVWAAAGTVFIGALTISATLGRLDVGPDFYAVSTGTLAGLLLSVAAGRDQSSTTISVYLLLATAEIVALTAVGSPPTQDTLVISVILGGHIAGVIGLLLLWWPWI
jgi:hypothetical protein